MNTQFLIDTINKPLTIYNLLHGTKYRLNRCGLLTVAVGILSGISVYAMIDRPIKKYLVPSAVIFGSGTTMFLLAKNNYSLKNKIAFRGIEYVKDIIINQVKYDYCLKNKLCNKANKFLEYADKQQLSLNNLYAIANKQIKSDLVSIDKKHPSNKFIKATLPLCTYINNKINNTKSIRTDIIEGKKYQEYQNLESCNLKLNAYQEALTHIKVFIYMEDNSKLAHDILLNNLQGILSYEELQDIDNILLKFLLLSIPENKVTTRKITAIETSKYNLINWANSYIQESRKIRRNIELIKHKYNLNINSYGVVEILNHNNLIDYMPE